VGRQRCLVIGVGRLAGGFVAPTLSGAGWDVVLGGRDPALCAAINKERGVWLRTSNGNGRDQWFGPITAVTLDDPDLPRLAASVDFFATSVGPSSLQSVGKVLAPLLRARLEASGAPINVVTFENHHRAPELLATGLFESEPSLATVVGHRLGISGAVAWRMVSRREVTSSAVRFHADAVSECYVDAAALHPGAAPLDGSLAGFDPVEPFERCMAEKLWVFNAGHATAAYLGWLSGYATVDRAMADPDVRAAVAAVVVEAQEVFQLSQSSTRLRARPLEWILARYADPGLSDPVTRVGREPRRKLAAGDRFIGPAVASLAIGLRPVGLANGIAAALSYGESSDQQAVDLRRELELLGAEEVLAMVSTLDPHEELTALICHRYRELRRTLSRSPLLDGDRATV
jgi:mannitol-1-phosphate 5-dehydrogenase